MNNNSMNNINSLIEDSIISSNLFIHFAELVLRNVCEGKTNFKVCKNKCPGK